uniref:Protein DEFECTIVE IN MERISTEM SILENCING 3 n=1 Tax=Anthurium amnicola TaxID=1678845 RepID=A0A1D1YP43_9ARAE
MPKVEMEEEEVEKMITHSKKLEHDLRKLGLKVKHREDNMRLLKRQINKIGDSIIDIQASLTGEEARSVIHQQTEQQTIEHILMQDKTAAAIVCSMKIHHALQASKLLLIKDVLGVVATLGKVKDDNTSRLLSEFLGLETMLAIVCKTYESVKALEEYDRNGTIDKNAGLHGLGPSIGRLLDGRFLVICLENLRTYTGEFVADDPQRRLALLKPKLPSGECPPGFLGFAVNMIIVDPEYLSCVTSNGHGLRETLFYSLFSHLQVYKTREEMQLAIPFISDGAISLDGGMIKTTGLFYLGKREDDEVRFPTCSVLSNLPLNIEEELTLMQWTKERHTEDMQREEASLNHVKNLFSTKKQELLQHLSETVQYVNQVEAQTVQNGFPKLTCIANNCL